MTIRNVARIIPSVATSDGAGVKLRRSIGARDGLRLDPFLMLDEFGTDNPDDYIAGFPPHPHRGFETVTYMIDGQMRHEDHMGNVGELDPGSVQWMTAGRGVIHSEMPRQTEGRMRGFQLWINLPAREKMTPAKYRDIPAEAIPVAAVPGGSLKVIAGTLARADVVVTGPIAGASTEPVFLDAHLEADAVLEYPLPSGHNAFVYVYEGRAEVGADGDATEVPPRSAAVLGAGDTLRVRATAPETRVVVLAGKPIGEPVVQYGPFVMNTREEIEQALADYRDGKLATVAKPA